MESAYALYAYRGIYNKTAYDRENLGYRWDMVEYSDGLSTIIRYKQPPLALFYSLYISRGYVRAPFEEVLRRSPKYLI